MTTPCIVDGKGWDNDGRGYRRISINGFKDYVHRIILEEKLGRQLLSNELALHQCDNKKCINPDHIIVGDQKQNTLDMYDRSIVRPRLIVTKCRHIERKHYAKGYCKSCYNTLNLWGEL